MTECRGTDQRSGAAREGAQRVTTDRLADLEIPPCRNRQLGHMHRICARCGRCEPGRRRVGDEQWCATCWGDANEAGLV